MLPKWSKMVPKIGQNDQKNQSKNDLFQRGLGIHFFWKFDALGPSKVELKHRRAVKNHVFPNF